VDINKTKKTILGNNYPLISPLIFSLIISLIVLAVFAQVLSADLVMWDDDITIYNNPKLGGYSLERIYWAFTDVDTMMRYNPLILISWITTYHFFGLNPFGYHLLNLLLHGLSSGILFLIIRKILLRPPLTIQNNTHKVHLQINVTASIATLLWSLHPLRVEPVAWVSALGHNQAVLFLLLSTLCYIKAIDSESDKKRYFFLIVSSFIFYTFSLFSYAIGITYFGILLIFDIFLFKRIKSNIGWWKSQAAKKVLLEKIIFANPAVLLGVISVIVRIKSAGVWKPPVSLSDFGILDRLMQGTYIIAYYIYRPFYPINLSPMYTTLISFDPLSLPFLLSAFGLFLFFILIFILRKHWPICLALLISHIIILIPVMGFFEHPHYHVDRYSLFSSICLSILIAFGLINLIKNKYLSVIFVSVLLFTIGVLSWLSFNQIKIWNNSESLFNHTIDTLGKDPYQQDIYWRLGKYLYVNGKISKAIMNFEKTLAINPNHSIAHSYLAQIEYENGNLIKAVYHLQTLLINQPDNFKAHILLSQIFNKLNKKEEALHHLDNAIKLRR
jgi:predicted negative regulator of RcsB-dependent stress response